MGWIGKQGFVKTEPSKADYIMPGFSSSPVALHSILTPGRHRLGIRAVRQGSTCHSFIMVRLSADPDFKSADTLEFMNEIEPDRAYICWQSIIIK